MSLIGAKGAGTGRDFPSLLLLPMRMVPLLDVFL